MKAFKQLDFNTENKIVFSYAGIMCLLGFFILLSPVFAQDDSIQSNQPKVHIDVKRQYDQNGNLSEYDSIYSWYWSGKGGLPSGFGSVDSLRYSSHPDLFNQDWPFDLNFQFPDFPGLFDYNVPLNDSLGISFHDFDELQKYFEDNFDFKSMMPDEEFFKKYDQQHDEFMERYRKYQKENQKLIEKYFGRPLQETDTIPGFERDRYVPDSKGSNPEKHGKI
jgi:hypothetical protein